MQNNTPAVYRPNQEFYALQTEVEALDWIDLMKRALSAVSYTYDLETAAILSEVLARHHEMLIGAEHGTEPRPRRDPNVDPPPVWRPRSAPVDLRRRLDGVLRRLRQAPNGNRNNALNRAAFAAGGLEHLGLSEHEATEALVDAAVQLGLSQREAIGTIRSGWRAGRKRPVEAMQ